LVDALTENVIWHGTYNRKQADLVSLQTEIARDVSSKLKSKLSGADERKLSKTYTTNSDAYRLYLQGRFNWNKREEKEFRKAIEFFDRAIALDPNYALAYAGLADAYALLGTFGFMPPAEAIPRSREYALKAIAIDDTLAEPHTTLAYIMADYDYDFVAAENEFKRAIELNPDYATAHQWYAEVLTYSGRFDESFAEFHRALELEPMSLPINWDYGRALYMSRRYDESIDQLKRTIEINPSFARGHRQIALPYLMKGDYANSIESHARFFELVGRGRDAALLRSTFASDGWMGVQRLLVSQDSPLSEGNNSWIVAKAAAALGDKEKAFSELQKLYDNRISSVCWLKVEPQLDALRDDPRYTELLKKIRFAE
jgi:tetratricopeptide (TPR) repeat protein